MKLLFLKKIISFILLIIIASCFAGCENKKVDLQETPEPAENGPRLGLYVGDDGCFYLDGKKFYGIGFNWHGGFTMATDRKQRERLPDFFAELKNSNVPFVRTMLGAFYDSDVRFYFEDRDKWFDCMDYFVSLAEQYHVGIIASFWCNNAYSLYTGEDFIALTDPYSKSCTVMKTMMTDIITRYKDSPAIWGWEIANESNLACEIDKYYDSEMKSENTITTEMIALFYDTASKVIRANDPNRMITNGDGGLRGAWKSLKTNKSWFPKDTEEDYDELFETFTPGEIDTHSIHYPSGESIRSHVERSRKMGLGLFIGEFHSTAGFTTGFTDSAGTEEREGWESIVQQMIDADVQLMCHWCWGRCIQQLEDPTSVEIGLIKRNGKPFYQNYYVWDRVRDINWQFFTEGKNNASEYWDKYGELSFAANNSADRQ